MEEEEEATRVAIGFAKRHEKNRQYVRTLLAVCQVKWEEITLFEVEDGFYYISFPRTKITMAMLQGFLFGKKCGWVMADEVVVNEMGGGDRE